MNNFNLRHFLVENKLTQNTKVLSESNLYDADDFIPFDDVEPGMIATDEDGERFKVIEKLDGEQIRCSLIDDPRDIETVKYGNTVMCHYSDQQGLDDDNEF